MNEKKISFIICTNDEFYMKECELYIHELVIPDGYEVEIVKILGAKSMAAGYNEGMSCSDAKYKIYLHQDVFVTNKNFLCDILEIFQTNTAVGMIGMVGTPYLAWTGTMWNGIRFGNFYKLEERIEKKITHKFYPLYSGYLEVEAIDGLLMATQYDLPWREDVFQKWDFYDVSQSFEFIKAGYKVVVSGQNPVGYIHDCGIINLDNYDKEREKFLEEYQEYMGFSRTQDWEEYIKRVKENVERGFYGSYEEKQRLLGIVEQIALEEK